MSILIKGLEMPATYPLTVTIYPDGQVLSETVGAKDIHGEAVPVPPHGELIDADALHRVLRLRGKEFSDSEYGEGVKCGLADARECIKIAPTVIPASKKEE